MFPNRGYPTEVERHLGTTDNEVLSRIREVACVTYAPGSGAARRIELRDHFRSAYAFRPDDIAASRGGVAQIQRVKDELVEMFGAETVRVDSYGPKNDMSDTCVLHDDGIVTSAFMDRRLLRSIPNAWFAYVLCDATAVDRVSSAVKRLLS